MDSHLGPLELFNTFGGSTWHYSTKPVVHRFSNPASEVFSIYLGELPTFVLEESSEQHCV